MKTSPEIKHPAAVVALQAADRDGASHTVAQATVKTSCRAPRFIACAVAGIALMFTFATSASAQSLTWDNTRKNPFVLSGNGTECTAYAWGRFKFLNNGTELQFTQTYGRHGGKLYELAVETPYVYRDSVPVRGSLISWKRGSDYGHAAVVETVNVDGKGGALISEANWPHGRGPQPTTLTATELQRRAGKTDSFTLGGFVNPNRPTAIGTLYTAKINSTLQLDVALLDEDRRSVNVLVALFDGNNVVSGTTGSGSVTPNRAVTVRWGNTSMLKRGKSYTIRFYATDFRELRSSKSTTFIW